jgi:hypothetical protein
MYQYCSSNARYATPGAVLVYLPYWYIYWYIASIKSSTKVQKYKYWYKSSTASYATCGGACLLALMVHYC